MNNKIIITFLIIFLIASFFCLAYAEQNQYKESDFWALYFSDPKDSNLNFIIENYGDKTNFHWEILADKDKIDEGNITIFKGNKEIINLSELGDENKKITIIVSDGDKKKEIYKN